MLLFVKFLSVLLLPVRCVPVFSGTLQLILLSIGFFKCLSFGGFIAKQL